MYISIFLCLTKRGKHSGGAFDPYLRTLPSIQGLQHLPIFWTNRQLDELQSSVVKKAVQTRRDEWHDEYDIVLHAIHEAGGDPKVDFVDLDTWQWARSIVTSRSFTDEMRDEPCLIPYIDMLNHISPGHAESREDVIKCEWTIDSSGFRLSLPEQQRDDQPIKSLEISYGSHSNSNFLMNYGFSIVDDEYQAVHDKATLSLNLPVDGTKDVELVWEAQPQRDCHNWRPWSH